MDALVTERGLQMMGNTGLETVNPAEFRLRLHMRRAARAQASK
jgi:hypothetical protein